MVHKSVRLRRGIATLLLTAGLVASASGPMAAENPRGRNIDASRSLRVHGTPVQDANARVEVFVQLSEPAVAELNASSLAKTGKLATSAAQRQQAQRVSAQQTRFRNILAQHNAEILSSQRVAANGLRVTVPASEVARLRELAEVRSVGRVEKHTIDNIDSVPWIGSPAVWAALGRGEGVKIGIIDTGIDYTHASFGGSGNPADYAANNPAIIEPGTFPTAKVVGGYDFAGPTYNANVTGSVPQPDPDPLDFNGHGTHVAGSAAGLSVPGSVGQGVAPGALLYALKVFGDQGGSTNLTSLAIEWAMDPNGDGDMSDRLDVINMSLGSPFGEPEDPSAISANNAAAVGVIVVSSAGNEGNTPYITGAPGVASSAISTAANTPGGRLYSRFQVTAPAAVAGTYPSLEGSGPVTFASTGPISGNLVPATPLDGCAPLTNAGAISGNIALIVRGTCDFLTKYTAAQNAGARAIVVFNDGAAADRIDPIVMGGINQSITIPGLMISYTVGRQLAQTAGVTVTIDAVPDPSRADQNADFTSRGPGHGGSTFKPDLAAPGVAIVSAAVGTGTGGAALQGTSMAAPHVAGAAALLRQKHPTLDQSAIKALLMNSTVPANPSGDNDLMRQGVGAVRVDRAVALTSYATPGGISFGRLNPLTPQNLNETFKLVDISGQRRNFTGRHVANQSYPGVQVSCPTQLRLNARGEAKFMVNLRFDPRAAYAAGVFDDAMVSQTEVDGWCVLTDGKDTLRIGYVAVVDSASNVMVLSGSARESVKVKNNGPALGWAEGFTLAKLDGELRNGTYGSIKATGFRRGDPDFYFGLNVLEIGLVTEKNFEHVSNLDIRIDVDANGDGVRDALLIATDLSTYFDVDPGEYAVFQFNGAGAGGFADWIVTTWDFNDQSLILPFTLASDGGYVPEKFNYVMTVIARNGDTDVQRGTIDLSKEIGFDLNSFGVDPNETIDIGLSGPAGSSLWLLQNNPTGSQSAVVQYAPRNR